MRYTLILLLFWTGFVTAQNAEKRVALVIGNSHYASAPLTNPLNDARDMAAALRKAGFSVTEKNDLNFVQFNNAVTDFIRQFEADKTVALFYYAGHGIQDNGGNYLVPTDADNLVEDEITYRCIPLERITSKMQDANNFVNILILDACRQYPMTMKGRSLPRGLAQFEGELPESLIAYATGPGRIANDQINRSNGLFTEKILNHILTPGLEIKELFFEVSREVKEQSNSQQIPSLAINLTRKFYFIGKPEETPEDTDKDGVPDSSDRCPADYGPAHLQGCPDGDHDGVINLLDKCPDLYGPPANNGCPKESADPANPSPWRHCFGVSYSRFGAKGGPSYEAVRYNAYQAYYAIVNKIGAYVSVGLYSGTFDLSNNTGLSVPTATLGAVGPGVRFLNTGSGVKGYVFAGVMLFDVKKDDEIFGHTVTDNLGYELLLAVNLKDVGFKAGYMGGFEHVKGVTVGVHYCF